MHTQIYETKQVDIKFSRLPDVKYADGLRVLEYDCKNGILILTVLDTKQKLNKFNVQDVV